MSGSSGRLNHRPSEMSRLMYVCIDRVGGLSVWSSRSRGCSPAVYLDLHI